MSTGLSKTNNLTMDRSKPGSVKKGAAPFAKTFSNSRPLAKGGGSTTPNPGGKLSPKKLAGVGRGK